MGGWQQYVSERVGFNVEMGWMRHQFSNEFDGANEKLKVKMSQFALNLGISILL
jgi:hypothetical protein